MNDATTHAERDELAHRSNDGVDVFLLWDRTTDELTVSVLDARTGDAFELAVDSGTAMDVFNHPYAHAAHRGVAYEAPVRVAVAA